MDYKREGSVPWSWRSAACTAMGQIAVSDYDQYGEYMGTVFVDTPEEADALFEDSKLDAPCGCPACDEQVQPGHFACEVSPPALLAWERRGEAYRQYDGGRWRWVIANEVLRDIIALDPGYIESMSRALLAG